MKQLTKERIKKPLLCVLAFGVSFAVIFLFGIVGEIVGLIVCGDDFLLPELLIVAIGEVGMLFAAITACWFVKKKHGTRLRETVRIKGFDPLVPLMLLLFDHGVTELVIHGVGAVMSRFMAIEPDPPLELSLISVIGAVVFAPLFEEILCRFGWCELARGAYSLPFVVIGNGLLFSVIHLYNIQGFFGVLAGGMMMAYVYCKTRNILYTMIEHALYNAMCFVDLSVVFGDYAYMENGFILYELRWLIFNAVLVATGAVYFLTVFRKKYAENYFETDPETGLAVI